MGMAAAQAGADPAGPAGPAGPVEAERFEAFYVREYHAVVRLAYALSGSRLAAEDIAQDAFLRAFRDWDHIRHPSAWVRKVAVRRAGRVVRRRLLEARALARLLAGRGPAVAELGHIDPAGNRVTLVRVGGCCAGELAAGEGRSGPSGTGSWSGSTPGRPRRWPGSTCRGRGLWSPTRWWSPPGPSG
jgi:Sigma-70 region 2